MAGTRRKRKAAPVETEANIGFEFGDISFIGKVLPVKRVETGIWSLDRAFSGYLGELGVPVTSMELYGPTTAGKSSFAYSVSAIVASTLDKKIALCDLEGFNPVTFSDILRGAGYSGSVYVANGEPDIAIDQWIEYLKQEDVVAGILDSVAAISPIGELNSSVGEANMGRRAKLVTVEQRKLVNLQRTDYKLAIHINHELPQMGGSFVYNDTPGGKGIHYLSAVRIRMRSKKLFSDGSFVIEGRVTKNRWGFKGRLFWTFFLMGHGLHPGMSAIWECLENKILYTPKSAKAPKWKSTGEDVPTMMAAAKLAREGNTEVFQPYIDALNGIQIVPVEEVEDETDDDADE